MEDSPFFPISHDHVGIFYEWNSKAGTSRTINVHANQELMIGRDEKTCQHTINDPTVSNKHLRIYTIIFDQESPGEVAPLIYAQDLSRYGTLWNGFRVWRHNGGVLLSDGDILRITPGIELKIRCAKGELAQPFDEVQRKEMKHFEAEYLVTNRKLGSGAYGQVHMAVEKKTAEQFACKIIDIRGLQKRFLEAKDRSARGSIAPAPAGHVSSPAELIKVKKWGEQQRKAKYIEEKLRVYHREAEILEKIQHPNIITLERVFKTENTIYIFQDLVTAGDLFSFLEFKKGKLQDIEAAVIVRQILIALDYLHDQNIVHRDLKPDNILMSSLSSGSRVVLTDFGCARRIGGEQKRMSTVMGTLEYTAPEVTGVKKSNRKGYTKAVDLWSLGCVTVVLLTGGSPFTDPVTSLYSEKLAHECDLEKLELDEDWMNAGERSKNFVRHLLVLDEDERMSVKQALMHQWFTNPSHKEEFERLYKRAVQDWRPRVRGGPVLSEMKFRGISRRLSNRPAPRLRSRKPIDPPYKPFPHQMNRILYPKPNTAQGRPGLRSRNLSRTLVGLNMREEVPAASPILSKKTLQLGDTLPSPVVQICNQEIVWGRKREEIEPTLGSPNTASRNPMAESQRKRLPQLLTTDSWDLNYSMPGLESHIRRPFSPDAWDRKTDTSKPPPKFPDLLIAQQSTNNPRVGPKKSRWPLQDRNIESKRNAPNSSLKRPCKPVNTPNAKKGRQGGDIFDFEEDQVFEEIDDRISGERRHVAYGVSPGPGYC